MSNLQQRQDKIKAKRMQTPFRDFVMEIGSWYTINLNRNNGMVSRYPETDRIKNVISKKEYNNIGNQEDIFEYSSESSFFDNLTKLRTAFKNPNTITFTENENSEYCDVIFGAKNSHLSFTIGNKSENILYSTIIYTNCTNVINCVKVTNNCQNIYYSKCISESFNIFYSKYISNSSDIRFSSNLIGCKECIFCDNLMNESYCINNIKYNKDEYIKEKNKILKIKQNFQIFIDKVNNIALNYNSKEISGEGINFSSNINNGYYVNNSSHGNNIMFISGINHANYYYDVFEAGVDSDDFYAVSNAGTNSSNLYCSTQIESSSNLFYCYHVEYCSFCLGCIGLKNKSYCILNKQYTKEERYEKVDEIFGQMETDGTLGQFFPADMNPFYFNDTAAYLIDPSFTKEEVTAKGYLRRDEPIKVDIPEGAQVVKTTELDQFEGFDAEGNRKIDESICKRVIIDESGNAYRVIPMELAFLNKYGLPLPRKHRLDRMKENFRIK